MCRHTCSVRPVAPDVKCTPLSPFCLHSLSPWKKDGQGGTPSAGLMCLVRTPPSAAGACRAAWRGAQGDVLFGGAVVNLGGGGDEPTPNPNGGGDSVRTLQSCGDSSCQFVEVRMVHGARICCPPARVRDTAGGALHTCRGSCLHASLHAGNGPAAQSSSQAMVAAQNQADPSQRLLAYRWYPTAVKNWDGRLLVASGLDLDENSGCVPAVA